MSDRFRKLASLLLTAIGALAVVATSPPDYTIYADSESGLLDVVVGEPGLLVVDVQAVEVDPRLIVRFSSVPEGSIQARIIDYSDLSLGRETQLSCHCTGRVEIEFSIVENAPYEFASVQWSISGEAYFDEKAPEESTLALEVVETRDANFSELASGAILRDPLPVLRFDIAPGATAIERLDLQVLEGRANAAMLGVDGDATELMVGDVYQFRLPEECGGPSCPGTFFMRVHSFGSGIGVFNWRIVSDDGADVSVKVTELERSHASLEPYQAVAELFDDDPTESWRVTVFLEDPEFRLVDFDPVLEFSGKVSDPDTGSSRRYDFDYSYRLAESPWVGPENFGLYLSPGFVRTDLGWEARFDIRVQPDDRAEGSKTVAVSFSSDVYWVDISGDTSPMKATMSVERLDE